MIFFYISLTTYICFTFKKYKASLIQLAKEKYNVKDFGKWIIKNKKEVFLTPELFLVALIIITLKANLKVIGICTVIAYTILYILNLKKKELKFNSKIITRIVILALIFIALNIWFNIDYNLTHDQGFYVENTPLYYIILIIMSYLSYFVTYIANIIAKPIDKLLKH